MKHSSTISYNRVRRIMVWVTLLSIPIALFAQNQSDEKQEKAVPVMWQDRGDLTAHDLFYGPEGAQGVPEGPFVFEKEDLDGTNPKYDVTDANGRSWTVKLGIEAQPEVAAVRLLWAAGYFVRTNYFVPTLQVNNLPENLERGAELIGPNGEMHGARLKLNIKKRGIWKWKENPFVGTKEFNGLRIMMSLLSNLDLKDSNNGIYRISDPDGSGEMWDVYLVNDVGCSFSERLWPYYMKGNLQSFRNVEFIDKVGPETVDFNLPVGPATVDLGHLVWHFKHYKQRWIGKDIPIEHAKWLGGVLGRLSEEEIKYAFRAAAYPEAEVQGFTDVILKKIAELNAL